MNSHLTPEQTVVLLLAVLGLFGGLIVHRVIKSSIITACFIGLGLASVVFGFLGGIAETTFSWGGLKATGSFAALIGAIVLVNHYLGKERYHPDAKLEKTVDVPVAGSYEWQWAGEGWFGHMTVDKDGAARIKMDMFVNSNGKPAKVPLLEQRGDGEVKQQEGGLRLSVEIPVQFIQYDGCNRTGLGEVTLLKGTLSKKAAYAGVIEYQSKSGGSAKGDMVLIYGYQSARAL